MKPVLPCRSDVGFFARLLLGPATTSATAYYASRSEKTFVDDPHPVGSESVEGGGMTERSQSPRGGHNHQREREREIAKYIRLVNEPKIMPRIVGSSACVVDHDGIRIDELAGNVASQDDTLSVAKVTVTRPTSEPWLTLDYDEWICCLKGKVDLHYGNGQVLEVKAGETCFIAKGERFQPVFPEAGTEYIPVCIPAFKPERCHREEATDSAVSMRLREFHKENPGRTNGEASMSCQSTDITSDSLYHMCQKPLWEAALASDKAYYPPTFAQDGNFTHATAVPARLVETANHFYTGVPGDWICVELSRKALEKIGIVTVFEEPKPVGETEVGGTWSEWRCPHIFGGIPASLPGVVKCIYPMKRDDEGNFLFIEDLTTDGSTK